MTDANRSFYDFITRHRTLLTFAVPICFAIWYIGKGFVYGYDDPRTPDIFETHLIFLPAVGLTILSVTPFVPTCSFGRLLILSAALPVVLFFFGMDKALFLRPGMIYSDWFYWYPMLAINAIAVLVRIVIGRKKRIYGNPRLMAVLGALLSFLGLSGQPFYWGGVFFSHLALSDLAASMPRERKLLAFAGIIWGYSALIIHAVVVPFGPPFLVDILSM